MDKKIWVECFAKERRSNLYFLVVLAIIMSVAEGSQIGYISMLWFFPLSLIVVYVGFVCGGYLNKWFNKKAKD